MLQIFEYKYQQQTVRITFKEKMLSNVATNILENVVKMFPNTKLVNIVLLFV